MLAHNRQTSSNQYQIIVELNPDEDVVLKDKR